MPHFRILIGIIDISSVDIWLNGKLVFENLTYKDVSAYKFIECKKLCIEVIKKDNGMLVLSEIFCKLKDYYYTISASGNCDRKLKIFHDRLCMPDTGTVKLRFMQLLEGAPPLNFSIRGVEVVKALAYLEAKYHDLELGEFSNPVNISHNGRFLLKLAVNVFFRNQTIHTFAVIGDLNNLTILPVVDQNELNAKLVCDFNINKYVGRWNVISRIPQSSEENLQFANQSVIYTELNDCVIKLYNIGYDQIGIAISNIVTHATIPDQLTPSALRVLIFQNNVPIPTNTPEYTQNVIGYIQNEKLGPNYLVHYVDYCEVSLVGTPYMDSLCILARNSKIPQKLYDKLLCLGRDLGYDISKMKLFNNTIEENCKNKCKSDCKNQCSTNKCSEYSDQCSTNKCSEYSNQCSDQCSSEFTN